MNIKKFFSPTCLLIYAITLYFAGAILIPRQNFGLLKRMGIAKQEMYTYTDDDGEEQERESLIELKGTGKILTYSDVYFSTIPLLVISLILARCVFSKEVAERDEVKCLIYTNSIVGILLIWLTRKPCVLSTTLFWAGIFVAYIAQAKDK